MSGGRDLPSVATSLDAPAEGEAALRQRVRQLEHSLRAAEIRLGALFELTGDACFIVNGDGVMVRINRRATERLGWQREELEGRPVDTILAGPALAGREMWTRALQPGTQPAVFGASGAALYTRCKDGTELPVELDLMPIEAEAGWQLVARLRDVSAQRELAEISARLAAAHADFEHERGMLDVLGTSSLRPHGGEPVNTGRASALGLLGIIDDIVDFARIEAGRLALDIAPFSIARLVEETCAELDPIACRKGVELYLYIDPQVPDRVKGDALRIRQVLNNLLSTAIEFSSGLDRPGRARVRLVCTELLPGEVCISLSIADNGIGMSDAVLRRPSQPLSAAEGSITRRFGGAGLRLSISRQLVELMRGSFGVTSAPGEGVQFTVALRLALDETAPARAMNSMLRLDGVGCCLVTDDRVARADWTVYLEHAGASVRHFPSAQALAVENAQDASATTVAIIDSGDDALDFATPAVDPIRRANPQLRYVLLGRGRRRTPRNDDAFSVSIDRGVLRHNRFIQAVALSCGRLSEEDIDGAAAGASQARTSAAPPAV